MSEPERPTNIVPDGLVRCSTCGDLKGRGLAPDPPTYTTMSPVTVTCLCEGLICGACEVERMHRPISNNWDDVTQKVWHSPYFMAMRRCGNCGESNWILWRDSPQVSAS